MNELQTYQETGLIDLESLPPVLRNALTAYQSIKTYEDVERYLLKGNGYSSNTLRSYLTSFRMFTEFLGTESVFSVTDSDIENWFDILRKTAPGNTVALRMAGVRAVYASLEKLLPESSPFRKLPGRLERKLKRASQKRLTALDTEEFQKLLVFATSKSAVHYSLVLFLVTTGLRASEAVSLRWKDIVRHNGAWTAYGTGKGDKDFEIPMPDETYQAVAGTYRLLAGKDPGREDPVFLNISGDPISYHTLWRYITALGEAAVTDGIVGAQHKITPHTMRRSCASILHTAGMSAKAIQGVTRHSKLETLEKHYLKNSDSPVPFWDKVFAA